MKRVPDAQQLSSSALIALGLICLILAFAIAYGALDGGDNKSASTVRPAVVNATPPPTKQLPKRSPSPTLTATPEPTSVPFAGPITTPLFDQKLADCNAYPNGSTHRVRETSRFFFSLPKDLFPDIAGFEFVTASGSAKAGWISNGGLFGYAQRALPGCWSWYFEFGGSGETWLTANSPVEGAPDYVVKFMVESAGIWPTGEYGPIDQMRPAAPAR